MTGADWRWQVRGKSENKGKEIALEDQGASEYFIMYWPDDCCLFHSSESKNAPAGEPLTVQVNVSPSGGVSFRFNILTSFRRCIGQLYSQSFPLSFIWHWLVYFERKTENQFSWAKMNLESHLPQFQNFVKVTEHGNAIHPWANIVCLEAKHT